MQLFNVSLFLLDCNVDNSRYSIRYAKMRTITNQSSTLLRTVSSVPTSWLTLLDLQVTPFTVVIRNVTDVTDFIGALTWPVLITFTLWYTQLILTYIAILNIKKLILTNHWLSFE